MSQAAAFIELIDEVVRLRGRIVAATGDFGSRSGLTSAQMTVVTAVVNAHRPPTVPQIARSLGLSRQAVQRVADTLVSDGFLALADNPDHQRARLLVATDKARRAQAQAHRVSHSWAERITSDVDLDELLQATETLRMLRVRLERDPASDQAQAS